MHNILLIFGALAFLLGGFMIVGGAPLYGWICMCVSAVMVAGYGITNAVVEMHKTMLAERDGKYKMNQQSHRQCPVCREIVRIDAARCKFCTSQITPSKAVTTPPAPLPEIAPTVPAPRQVNPQG